MLYESYIHPLTILSGLPSAGLGALVTLWLFGNELNIYSFVGLIMLIGIVKKNAIMQIDFALEAERRHGKTPAEAIYEGCLIRFRPIMMTTMAALLGARADRARLRRRRRSAAAARPGGRRRPGRLAADHALSDAGRLHLHGRAGENAQAAGSARLRDRVVDPLDRLAAIVVRQLDPDQQAVRPAWRRFLRKPVAQLLVLVDAVADQQGVPVPLC